MAADSRAQIAADPRSFAPFHLRTSASSKIQNSSGFTLIELLTATLLSVIVILAIGQVDVSRVRLSQEIRRRGPGDQAFAMAYIAKSLQNADRINLVSQTSVQFREFTGDPAAAGAFDDPANYSWRQYRLAGSQIILSDSACTPLQSFSGITSLLIQYEPSGAPPPSGYTQLFSDNNVLLFTIDGQYTSEITIRAGAFTDTMTGLAPPLVSNPPAACV